MPISSSAAQTLAAALLQLNPLLGLTLVWSEPRLERRDIEDVKDQPGEETDRREDNSKSSDTEPPLDQTSKNEWFLFIIFLHSITWPILAIASPSTLTIDIALGISAIWLLLSIRRITRTIAAPKSTDSVMFRLGTVSAFPPLLFAILAIQ